MAVLGTRSALFRVYKEKLKKPNFCAGFEFLSEQKGLFSLRRAETNFWNKDYSLFEQKKKRSKTNKMLRKQQKFFLKMVKNKTKKKLLIPLGSKTKEAGIFVFCASKLFYFCLHTYFFWFTFTSMEPSKLFHELIQLFQKTSSWRLHQH